MHENSHGTYIKKNPMSVKAHTNQIQNGKILVLINYICIVRKRLFQYQEKTKIANTTSVDAHAIMYRAWISDGIA